MSLLTKVIKFGLPFELLKKYSRNEQLVAHLDKLVDDLDKHHLLDRDILQCLIDRCNEYSEVESLDQRLIQIRKATALNCKQVKQIIKLDYGVIENICALSESKSLTTDALYLILDDKAPDVVCSIYTILIKEKIESDEAISFINSTLIRQGLDEAFNLFQVAEYKTTLDNLNAILDLANIMQNPLILEIYQARLRKFSDYDQSGDPLNKTVARMIISKIKPDNVLESTKDIFNCLATLRPFPPSQFYCPGEKDGPTFSLQQHAINAAETSLEKLIKKAKTKDESCDVKKLLEKIKLEGLKHILDEIRFEVAASQVNDDKTENSDFEHLMTKVDETICQLNPNKLSCFGNAKSQSESYHAFLRKPYKQLRFMSDSSDKRDHVTHDEDKIVKKLKEQRETRNML